MTDPKKEDREQFEAWISAPPYERELQRWDWHPNRAWPGQYKDYQTQLAWDSWQAALQQSFVDKRDAERYRWLRERGNSLEQWQMDKAIDNGVSCYHIVDTVRELKHGDELDSAIDAALTGTKQLPQPKE